MKNAKGEGPSEDTATKLYYPIDHSTEYSFYVERKMEGGEVLLHAAEFPIRLIVPQAVLDEFFTNDLNRRIKDISGIHVDNRMCVDLIDNKNLAVIGSLHLICTILTWINSSDKKKTLLFRYKSPTCDFPGFFCLGEYGYPIVKPKVG